MTVASDNDMGFPPPTTTAGGPVLRRRSVLDRQRATQQLLITVAEETYDGELDIAWDREPAPGVHWMPQHLTSIFGTRLWRSLTNEQRDELCRRELVDLLTLAMYAQSAAAMLTFRTIALEQGLGDDRTRFQLAMVNELSRNVTMFSRLVNRTGATPHLRRRSSERLAHFGLMTPKGPLTKALILLSLEFAESIAREAISDGNVQPHVLQLMKIHNATADPYLRFSRGELWDSVDESAGTWGRLQGSMAAVAVVAAGHFAINQQLYRDAGIGRFRGLWAAYTSGNHRVRLAAITGSFVEIGMESGLFAGRLPRAILRVGRCLPKGHTTLPSAA